MRIYTIPEIAIEKNVTTRAVRLAVDKGTLVPLESVNGTKTKVFDEVSVRHYLTAVRRGRPRKTHK